MHHLWSISKEGFLFVQWFVETFGICYSTRAIPWYYVAMKWCIKTDNLSDADTDGTIPSDTPKIISLLFIPTTSLGNSDHPNNEKFPSNV